MTMLKKSEVLLYKGFKEKYSKSRKTKLVIRNLFSKRRAKWFK